MAIVEKRSETDLDARYKAAIDRAARGIRDTEVMEQAAREMDDLREKLRRTSGETDIAAQLTDPDDE
jgi:hypothetical protein